MLKNTHYLMILALMMYQSNLSHAKAPVAFEVDPQAEVLGKVGKVKIQKEFCNTDGYDCDYILYDTQGRPKVLLEDWSRTAQVYQFNSKQMGFLYGATGSGHILTVIDDQNKQKDYANFEAMNKQRSCLVTFEKGLKNMPDSLVFYSVPDFRVRLVLNKNVPQFKKLNDPTGTYFEENGDFNFEYSYPEDGELSFQNVIIQNPCQMDYRIVMN